MNAQSILAIKGRVPWWTKLGAKTLLNCLPAGYGCWRALSVCRHGGMERPDWAYATFRRHYQSTDFARKGDGFVVLELGPGDSLFTAADPHAHGASGVYLVDVAPYANRDPAIYQAMVAFLAEQGFPVTALSGLATVAELLSACAARYETMGLASLQALPTASVDFIFSNAVLQHVHRSELAVTLGELRRLLRPGGACSHSIDLRDMMSQSLNHLRFSERLWESALVYRSGFYSNGSRLSEWVDLFRGAGFDHEVTERNCWERLPIARHRLAPAYRRFGDDDLRVATFHVVLRPA